MNEQELTSTVVVVLPGHNVVTYVVQQSEEGTQIHAHADAGIPPAAPLLLLVQLARAIAPASHTGFHLWQAEFALKAEFDAVNDQMANVPAMSEDELPF